ncbi:MAG TPA: threonylcarbamoyl-AMP synthase [bacterium]|nr:threonylcarbamoyl-AMP synthase [bacterium]
MTTQRLAYPISIRAEPLVPRFVECVHAGGVIGYPTETVYGLGGDALNTRTIERIYRLKGRAFRNPLLVLVRDRDMLKETVRSIPSQADVLIRAFWPGPLTLIFEKCVRIPGALTGGSGTVAVRMSPDPFCRFVFTWFDRPLISTSANPSGAVPAQTEADLIRYFGGKIDWAVDGGKRQNTTPSTLLDLTCIPPRLVREGGVTGKQIELCIGAVS